jgi:hypothetical protein
MTRTVPAGRKGPRRLRLAGLAVAILAVVVPAFAPARAGAQTVVNQDLAASCGVDVTLIIDRSNSISTLEADDIRNAARALIRGLAGTGARVQVITFATRASAVVRSGPGAYVEDPDLVDLRYYDASELTDLPAFYAAGGDAGGTNWDDALEFARRASNVSPLTVFLTDGDPTYYLQPAPDGHGGSIGGSGSSTGTTEMARATQEADYLRTGVRPSGPAQPPTHLFGVGVGLTTGTSEGRVAAVTGPDELTLGAGGQVLVNGAPGEFAGADYTIVPNFDDLEFAFVRFVWALCSQELTVRGTLQGTDGSALPTGPLTVGLVLGPNAPNAWTTPASATGTSASLTTTEGSATFDWSPAPPAPATNITVTLSGLPEGYTFNGVRCTTDDQRDTAPPAAVLDTVGPNQAGSTRGAPTWSIPGGVGIRFDASCEVFLRQLRGPSVTSQRMVVTAAAPSPRGGQPLEATAVVDVDDDDARTVRIVSWRTG